MATPNQVLKTCTKCGSTKPISEFYAKDYGRHGVAAECKLCTRGRTKKRYTEKHDEVREKDNTYQRAKRVEIREATYLAYGGYKCACCGEADKMFLTLDHINNDGADFRRMLVGSQAKGGGYVTYRWLAVRGFPPGYQVLCMNCNYGKRMNGGVCPHQERRDGHPVVGVGSSEPKRNTPQGGDDMTLTSVKTEADPWKSIVDLHEYAYGIS
jgi:hypothetical protein